MASTVINDPEAIHAYRQQIAAKVQELQDLLKRTDQSLETVSQSWKDNNFKQFQEKFSADKQEIAKLFQVLNAYDTEVLYNLEQKLQRYVGGRMSL